MSRKQDYPTDDDLQRIREWTMEDRAGALDFVASIWHWPDFGVSHELSAHEAGVIRAEKDAKYLRLATGGWSGNEEIEGAMEQNLWLRVFCWRLSARGGLSIWEYPTA